METVGTRRDNVAFIDRQELMSPVIAPRKMRWIHALVLVAGYVALDWVSFFHPLHGLNITPWSPALALGLVFILRFGASAIAVIGVAIFVGDALIRGLPVATSLTLAAVLASGYGLTGKVLSHRLKREDLFESRDAFFTWIAVVTPGTLVTSAVYISVLVLMGLVPADAWSAAFVRNWIGDLVGVLVSMPVMWLAVSGRGRALMRRTVLKPESLLLLAVAAATLWIAFRLGADAHFKYLYVLSVPMVWAAARQGLVGAILIAAVLQIGIIVATDLTDLSAISVLEIQMLTVVQALLGFFVGVITDERLRIGSELRQSLRLAAAGEMAGALAHELNQPLTALSSYAAACDKLLSQGKGGDQVREAMRRIIAESERAGEVVSRLRDFFRTGTTQLELLELRELLDECVASFAARARASQVVLTLAPVPACRLLADRLQLEVVMRNLLANAFDAVAPQPPAQRRVRVSAQREGVSQVRIQVDDSGPGLSAATAAHLFEPFESTKSSGLGLGLAISRAIVHAHGGGLWTEVGDHGVFTLMLQVDGEVAHVNQ